MCMDYNMDKYHLCGVPLYSFCGSVGMAARYVKHYSA